MFRAVRWAAGGGVVCGAVWVAACPDDAKAAAQQAAAYATRQYASTHLTMEWPDKLQRAPHLPGGVSPEVSASIAAAGTRVVDSVKDGQANLVAGAVRLRTAVAQRRAAAASAADAATEGIAEAGPASDAASDALRVVPVAAGFRHAAAAFSGSWEEEFNSFPDTDEEVAAAIAAAAALAVSPPSVGGESGPSCNDQAVGATKAPMLRIMRRDGSYGTGVPIQRIVGYFPGAPVDRMLGQLTDPVLRRTWDNNYRGFEELLAFPITASSRSSGPRGVSGGAIVNPLTSKAIKSAASPRQPVTTPGPAAAVTLDAGNGDSPDSLLHSRRPQFAPTHRHWCYHRVMSPMLERLGIRPRLFYYERVASRWALPQLPLSQAPASVVYRSLRPDVVVEGVGAQDAGVETPHPVIAGLLKVGAAVHGTAGDADTGPRREIPVTAAAVKHAGLPADANKDSEVFVHGQEILLLPVTRAMVDPAPAAAGSEYRDSVPSLLSLVAELADEGNPLESRVPHRAYAKLAHAGVASPYASERETVGTLMVLTSANDGGQQSSPKWLQRLAGRHIAEGAYTNLLVELRREALRAAAAARTAAEEQALLESAAKAERDSKRRNPRAAASRQ